MITRDQLRMLARRLGVRQDFAEKDYVNSWILWGIYTGNYGSNLLFKGGTALSKLYFPSTWRFSEDLDFGVDGHYTGSRDQLRTALDAVTDQSGIEFSIREHHEARQPQYPTHYVDGKLSGSLAISWRGPSGRHPRTTPVTTDTTDPLPNHFHRPRL